MYSENDRVFMTEALRLATKGLFTTSPNPRVGCVISDKQRIIARGWHRRTGQAHAEVEAIESICDAGNAKSLRGATAYLTLEPCSHYGKTPPCCEILSEVGISRVVVAMRDPDPRVSGRGIAFLRNGGIQVEVGLLAQQAHELNIGFVSRMTRQRPWVRVKLASSIDGKTALNNGKSQWITGQSARRDVHYWRARSDCILTGGQTVRQDDPRLTARLDNLDSQFQQPRRAIVSSANALNLSARVFNDDAAVSVFSTQSSVNYDALPHVEHIVVEADRRGKVDLQQVLKCLAKREINEVHVEAGANLCGALLALNCVDELVLYQANIIIGSAARGLFDLAELGDMSQSVPLKLHNRRQFGDDVRSVFRPLADESTTTTPNLKS